MTLSPQQCAEIDQSALFVILLTPQWWEDPLAQAQVRYAERQGKPFRVLLYPGARIPEEAFLGVTDLHVVQLHSSDPAVARDQILRWIEETRP